MAVNPWRTFARNHPKAAKWVWQIGVFYLFSLAVTVLQYALFTFLPYLFGEGLASTTLPPLPSPCSWRSASTSRCNAT